MTSTQSRNNLTHAHAQSLTLTQQALHTSLTHRLQQLYPSNEKAIARYLKNHLHTIIEDMYLTYTSERHLLYSEYYYFNATGKRTSWGRLTINGKKYWGTDILVPVLMLRISKGFTGVSSAYDIKDLLLIAVLKEYSLQFTPAPVQVNSDVFINTKCNRASLEAYVNNASNDIKNRRKAKTILASLDKDDYFKQEIKQPVVNRTYLLGLNLQQVSKEVRAAVLSGQYAYDINCAVFALFASVAHELSNTTFPTIMSYIKDRTSIRQQIADETGLNLMAVKRALIAVGFGKRAKDANDLAVVVTTQVGKDLVKEFRTASSIVYRNFKDDKPRGKRLAELFAMWESELMKEFIAKSGEEANLTIHDCVVTINAINIKQVLPLMGLSFTTHREYFDFEETEL